ncbi:MAG: site-specific DNA-methyltransferase [Marinagarivorans sp.]|nr:site-specific DNA-methyltransferase [Marinagarivorans sp.]
MPASQPASQPASTKCTSTIENNRIIHGDNLEALKSLLPEYEGKINCIYIDPPYNTGTEGWRYNDNVNDPKIKKWLGKVVGEEGEDLSRHDKWLCMMYPRLKLLHRLLADDGAIFISIDENEQASLRLIMDEIFGTRNFVEATGLEQKNT